MILDYFNNISFARPEFFYLLAIIPLLLLWYIIKGNKKGARVMVSSIEGMKKTYSLKIWLRHLPFIFRLTAIARHANDALGLPSTHRLNHEEMHSLRSIETWAQAEEERAGR